MLTEAAKLLQNGNPEKALSILIQYTCKNPLNTHGWYPMAVAYQLISNKLPDALNIVERVISIDPTHIQVISATGTFVMPQRLPAAICVNSHRRLYT